MLLKLSPNRRLIALLVGCLLIAVGAAGLYAALGTGMFIGYCNGTEGGDECVTYLSTLMTASVAAFSVLTGALMLARLRSWRAAVWMLAILAALAVSVYALSAFQECVVMTEAVPCPDLPNSGACPLPARDCSPQPNAYLGFLLPIGLIAAAYYSYRQRRNPDRIR